jgi:hypothetical protein
MKKSPMKTKDLEGFFLLKLIKIFVIAFVAAVILRFLPIQDLEIKHTGKIRVGTQVLTIEYASGNEKVAKGLSGRKELPKDHGMFFVFPTDGNYYFWMKDMLFPIDIIFLGSDYKIIDILYNAPPCGNDDCPKVSPQEKFRYVLEVNSGLSKENELKIGDQFEIIK